MGLLQILIIAAMLVLNALFAAYELALASVKPARLKRLAAQHRPGARAAVAMKSRTEASLAVVQLGITLVGAIAAATGGAGVEERLAPSIQTSLGINENSAEVLALTLFVVPLAAVTIILGELVPKVFAIRNPERVCLILSPGMRMFAAVVFPAVWCFEQATKGLLRVIDSVLPIQVEETQQSSLADFWAQVKMLRASRMIGPQQEQIMLQASRLSSLRIEQIMLPADDIVMLEADAPLTQHIVQAHLHLHTRFPVTEQAGDPQAIIGYVNIKELMFLAKTHPQNPSIREIVRPLISFRHNTRVSDAMTKMFSGHIHLALVRDADDRVLGMVTQENVFEQLVGDIQDEFDRAPRYLVPSGSQWIAGGGVLLEQLREALGRSDLGSNFDSDTPLADWLADQRSGGFKGGDEIEAAGLHVLVRKVRRNRIAEAVITAEPKRISG